MNLNLKLLNELIDLSKESGEDLIGSLYIEFKKTAPEMISEIRHGYIENDMVAMEEAAHKLKSSSGSFGLAVVSQLALGIMTKAHKKSIEGLDKDVEALIVAFDEQMKELESYLKQLQLIK